MKTISNYRLEETIATFINIQYKSAFDTAIANAQAKGWTINFAS